MPFRHRHNADAGNVQKETNMNFVAFFTDTNMEFYFSRYDELVE